MIRHIRVVLLSIIAAVTSAGFYIAIAEEPARIGISIDRKFGNDGWDDFPISEDGVGPTGSYHRKFSFAAQVKRGVVIPGKIRNYEALMTSERGGIWKTQKEPIAGYMYVFFEDDRVYVDVQLLESWDGHPTRMTINGVHPVAVR